MIVVLERPFTLDMIIKFLKHVAFSARVDLQCFNCSTGDMVECGVWKFQLVSKSAVRSGWSTLEATSFWWLNLHLPLLVVVHLAFQENRNYSAFVWNVHVLSYANTKEELEEETPAANSLMEGNEMKRKKKRHQLLMWWYGYPGTGDVCWP